MSVVRQQYATSDIDQAAAALASAFSGAGMRLATPDGTFEYGHDYRGAATIATVTQRLSAHLRAVSDRTDTVLIGWTELGSTTYRVGGQEVSGDVGLVWSGRTSLQAEVGYAVNRSILLDRTAFETRARLLLARDASPSRTPPRCDRPSTSRSSAATRTR